MSLLSMFTRKKATDDKAPPPDSSLLPQDAAPQRAAGESAPSSRRTERTARRELLFTVVRECMNRAGVLSASYKFKVLSLDSRGRQFLVMVDLPGAQLKSADRLAEIEAMVAQAAKARHDIVVKAMYWRQNDHVAVGLAPPGDQAAKPQAPAPAKPVVAARPEPGPATPAGYEPIGAEEVAAFRQALATGTKPPVKQAGPQNYTLLTGFENTEIRDEPPQALSTSQYGELR